MADMTTNPTSRMGETIADEVPLDVTADLLRSHRRRMVLRYLLSRGGSSTLEELAEHIAANESEDPEHDRIEADRARVSIALIHCHLPKLEDAGVVLSDDQDGVELTDAGGALESALFCDVDIPVRHKR